MALRGKKSVLRGPSWPFVDKKVFSVVLRGPPWTKKVFLVVLRGPSWIKKGVLRGPSWPSVDEKGVLSGPSWPSVDKKGVLRGPSWPFVDKKGVLCGPPWPSVDKIRFSPRPFADRPNYNRAKLSSDKPQRALLQRSPSPLDPCNRSYNAPTSTRELSAPLPSRKSPHNPVNPASDNKNVPTLAMPASVV